MTSKKILQDQISAQKDVEAKGEQKRVIQNPDDETKLLQPQKKRLKDYTQEEIEAMSLYKLKKLQDEENE